MKTETMSQQRVPIEDLLAHREWIRRLARGLVRDAAERDDVEQETWLRALRALPATGGSLRGWLARVVRSVGIDRHRAERQRRLREQGSARPEAGRTEDAVAQAEAFRRVVEVAYGLEEPDRTVVILRYFEELPLREVGRRLGIDEEAARSRLRRALARMRERLEERSGGGRDAWMGAVIAVGSLRGTSWGTSWTPPLVAAGAAGGVVMGAAKITAAAAVVLASLAWWALRDEGESVTENETAAVAPPASGTVPAAPAERRGRAAQPTEEASAPAATAPAADAPPGAAEPPPEGTLDREVRRRVLDQRGTSVAGATVRIVRADQARLLRFGAEATAVTDESGAFEVRAPQGDLVARVSLEGYVDFQTALVEGETELRVRLLPAWTLRGTVVARETGEGVAGMRVTARRAGTDEVLGGGLSGETGAFAVSGLPEEPVDLRVEDFAGALGFRQPGPEAIDVPVEIPKFAPARLSSIPARSGELRIELAPGRSIAGRLVDDAGAAVTSGVVLELIGRTAQGGPDYSERRHLEIQDPAGAFRIDGLSDREYDLSFVPAPQATETERTLGAQRVPSVAAGTTDLRVVLSAGAPLRFRVLDADGKPLDGGYLYVHPPGRLAGDHGTVIAAPRLEGRFETAPLDRSRTFEVLATGFPGHLQARRKGLQPGGDEVVLQLESGGKLAGRVLDEDGHPVGSGVPVSAIAQGRAAPGPGTAWVSYTDASGAFTMDTLGDHAFALTAGGGESGFVPAETLRDVRLGRASVVLRVLRGVTLSGRLLDSAGKPVRTHLLSASPIERDGAISATTKIEGDDGRFVFRGVRAGRVRLACYVGERYVEIGEADAPATELELELPDR